MKHIFSPFLDVDKLPSPLPASLSSFILKCRPTPQFIHGSST